MPNTTEQSTFLDKARELFPEMNEPRHTAALGYLASRQAFLELRHYFLPKPESGAVSKYNARTEFHYHPGEHIPTPQFKVVFQTTVVNDLISPVDMVIRFHYRRERLIWDVKDETVVHRDVKDYYRPLLVLVQLDPITVEPAVVEFNRIRRMINANVDLVNEISDVMESECVLVTERPLICYEQRLLESENIVHYQLGEAFWTYLNEQWNRPQGYRD